MKKQILFVVALAYSMMSMAQSFMVQGVPRQAPGHVKKTLRQRSVAAAAVDFDAIRYWVGNDTCSNKAALVIKFNDGKGADALVWGYRWAKGTTVTGEDMFRAVAAADPRLLLFTQNTNFGSTVAGVGLDIGVSVAGNLAFDFDAARSDNLISFGYYAPNTTLGQTTCPGDATPSLATAAIAASAASGILQHPLDHPHYGYSAYDYDYWQVAGADDLLAYRWQAGWYKGYWSYWTSPDHSGTYSYSSVGMTSRTLNDGCVDGWSYCTDMTMWYSATMEGEPTYVEAPSANVKPVHAVAPRLNPEEMEKNHITVTTTEYNGEGGIAKAVRALDPAKYNIITIDETLRGKTIRMLTGMALVIGKKNTWVEFNGNGVVIETASETQPPTFGGPGEQITIIRDVVFNLLKPVSTGIGNVVFENCLFTNLKDGYLDNNSLHSITSSFANANITYKACRFDKFGTQTNTKTSSLDRPCIMLKSYKNKKNSFNFVSCTFTGISRMHSDSKERHGRIFGLGDEAENGQTKVSFYNCVIDANMPDVFNSTELPAMLVKENCTVEMKNTVFRGFASKKEGETVTAVTFDETNPQGNEQEVPVSVDEKTGEYFVLKEGKAYGLVPSNIAYENITLPEKDILGNVIDYTKPTHAGACQRVVGVEEPEPDVDYTKGTFIVNEDWYGHQNSTINFLTDEGEWIYRVVQKENPGRQLGCTAQYGTIYGDRFYVMSKQEKDPGATVEGARLTVLDAKTMKILKQIPFIALNEQGQSIADGRGFLGVDEHKAYIGTSNGIYTYDIDKMEVGKPIVGTANGEDSPYGQLYMGQIGNMVRVNDRVFAVHQKNGLLVIDPTTDSVTNTIKLSDEWATGTLPGVSQTFNWGFGSVVLSKDGNLWCSVSEKSGNGVAARFMLKVNPVSLDTAIVHVPEGLYGPANSWYAWTPDGFCAGKQHNVLYWNGGNGSWFSNKAIYKYDIDKNEFSKFLDFEGEPWKIYGCSFRVDPVTDESLVSLYKEFNIPTYIVRRYDNTGKMLQEYSMIENYWFPSLPVYPDNAGPVVTNPDAVSRDNLDAFEIPLAALATDADNMEAAIVKTIKSVSDEAVLTAEMKGGNLLITPKQNGSSEIAVKVNSNGKLAEALVSVVISHVNAVDMTEAVVRSAYAVGHDLHINHCEGYRFAVYSLSGVMVDEFDVDNQTAVHRLNAGPGTYILQGTGKGEKMTFKIVVQ